MKDKDPKDNSGFTPTHYAALFGHLSICKFFYENISEENSEDLNGWTPLHLAAQNGHLPMCLVIIKNVEEKSPKTLSGKTPSQVAVDFGHDGLAKFLKAYETDTLPQPTPRKRRRL